MTIPLLPRRQCADRATLACVIAALASIVVALAPARAAIHQDEIDRRLAALDPSRPLEYFELGEELAYESDERGDIDLARRLYVLAYELDRRRDGDPRLGASVCLALADLTTTEDERRWLLAMAQAARPGGEGAAWRRAASELSGSAPEFLLAEALGRWRSGDYRRAQATLDKPDVRAALRKADALLSGQADRVLHDAQSEPTCRECRNRRVVRTGTDPNATMRLCQTCGGNPGPRLSQSDLLAELRTEQSLVGGTNATWSAQIAVDGGAPLREVDPSELAPYFKVDPDESVWRAGAWARPVAADAGAAP